MKKRYIVGISLVALLLELAERDMRCVLISTPYNLAVLNPNAAEGIFSFVNG